jgi:hypothetical protein
MAENGGNRLLSSFASRSLARISFHPNLLYMKTIRLFAVGTHDDQYKLVLVGQLDEAGFLNRDVEAFGYITDVELDTSARTKSIFQLTERNNNGVMFYGDDSCDPTTTNIYSKPLKVGELFSVFYDHGDPETNESMLVVRTISDY